MDIATLAPQRLGSLLIDKGYLAPNDLHSALETQKREGRKKLLGEILVEQKHCTEDQVVECLAVEYGVPYAKLDARLFDPKVVDILPREYIEKNLALPLFLVRGVLTIAAGEPSNLFLIDEVRGLTGMQVQIVAAGPKDIRRMIAALPVSKVFMLDRAAERSNARNAADAAPIEEDEDLEHLDDAEETAGPSAVVGLVNRMILDAVKAGASDIHVEPSDRLLRVRYRVDGRLHRAMEVPRHMQDAVAGRIKSMGAMDVEQRTSPQEGRFHVILEGRKIDLRASTFPILDGEKIAIRVLDVPTAPPNLEDLGFAEDVLAAFRANLQSPGGMILVAGPSRSGKSTTLYATIGSLDASENNICTVENPIECRLPLVNQFQTQPKIGMTFSAAIRTLLRQDPDVLLVGELGEAETARAAIEGATAGRLVFGGLRAGDACSAVAQLIHIGVEPYLLGAALRVVLAQRLVRRICSRCRAAYEPSRPIRKAVERLGYEIHEYSRGVGCPACRNTGFRGRIGIHELLTIDDPMRDAILAKPGIAALRKAASDAGMISLGRDGFRKVREGIATAEEVLQILQNNGK